MKYPNAWDKYCKLVWVPSFVIEMTISVGPDQTALLRVSFDQGLHCLIRPVRLIGWLYAALFFFFLIIMYMYVLLLLSIVFVVYVVVYVVVVVFVNVYVFVVAWFV